MTNNVNNKRVFLVVPHVPNGYLDIVGKRDDVRLDKLDNGGLTDPAKSVLAAAHAYQTSSTRDELARHYHTGAELLQHTPNLLIVSTNVEPDVSEYPDVGKIGINVGRDEWKLFRPSDSVEYDA